MNSISYIPSTLSEENGAALRKHSFRRWMSTDLLQATTDFCKNISLLALYVECSPENRTRYLFWNPPDGTKCEIRSGRDRARFEALDKINADRRWRLLTLHINIQHLYSAIWIAEEHYETASAVLKCYGISPAIRNAG